MAALSKTLLADPPHEHIKSQHVAIRNLWPTSKNNMWGGYFAGNGANKRIHDAGQASKHQPA